MSGSKLDTKPLTADSMDWYMLPSVSTVLSSVFLDKVTLIFSHALKDVLRLSAFFFSFSRI
jgi:hypothetical protein